MTARSQESSYTSSVGESWPSQNLEIWNQLSWRRNTLVLGGCTQQRPSPENRTLSLICCTNKMIKRIVGEREKIPFYGPATDVLWEVKSHPDIKLQVVISLGSLLEILLKNKTRTDTPDPKQRVWQDGLLYHTKDLHWNAWNFQKYGTDTLTYIYPLE